MQEIVGLLGVKGSGKDTCARYLVEERGYQRVGFADALYQEAADAFGVTVAFLSNRDTKETPLPELAMVHCRDAAFTQCVAEELGTVVDDSVFLSEPRSPRFVLQLWGTEYRRRRGVDSYWLDKVRDIVQAQPMAPFVITDVRFLNEFRFVHELGGILVRIRRPELEAFEAAERLKKGRAAHASETELLNEPTDGELFNEEGRPESLRSGILTMVDTRGQQAA